MQNLAPRQLTEYLATATPRPLLLDVREPWEFEICHIDGTELIPMGQIQAALHNLDPQRETVVICHHGIRSRRVAMYLEHQGFIRVINLHGGLDAWARDVDHHMATY